MMTMVAVNGEYLYWLLVIWNYFMVFIFAISSFVS
jgi:hypothetical protein